MTENWFEFDHEKLIVAVALRESYLIVHEYPMPMRQTAVGGSQGLLLNEPLS